MSDPIIRLKRSSVEGKVPTTAQLLIGELAVNAFDGQVFLKQDTGGVGISTRVIAVGAGGSLGKTIFVTKSGNDSNSGLNERDAKASIKAAAELADQFDTIKVYAGQYIENNPIILRKNVSVEGLELRNCLVTPQNSNEDLFHVNDGVHITDLSFVGPPATEGAAVIAFRPLEGVSPDRYFDAARMIRYNSDFIAREAVGFLTSGYSGYAGTHVAQDAAVLLEANLDFIANEAVGYLTSTNYKNPAFVVPTTDQDCRDDIKDIFKSIAYDLKATGNEKSVGAALSYFSSAGALIHITGSDTNGYGISTATVDTISYAVGIATYVINNKPYGSVAAGATTNITGFIYDNLTGLSTVTSVGHGVTTGDIIKLNGVKFTCPGGSGITTNTFPDGKYGYFFKVEEYVNANTFKVYVGVSSIPHTYSTGGTVERYENYQTTYSQAFDPTRIQTRVEYDQSGTKYVRGTGWCVGVANSISYLAGIVTSAVGSGSSAGIVGIQTGINLSTFKCSRDIRNIWKAVCYDITRGGNSKCVSAGKTYFDQSTGEFSINTLKNSLEREQTISALDYSFNIARNVVNNATWGGVSIGLTLPATNIIYDQKTGLSTITVPNHGLQKYDSAKLAGFAFTCPEGSPGTPIQIISATYDNISGITTIETSSNNNLSVGNRVRLQNLVYQCDSGGGPSTSYFPSGNFGYDFTVSDVITGTTFSVNVGTSTITHDYIGGGNVTRLYTPTFGVSTASYDRITGITTIRAVGIGSTTAIGFYAEPGQKVKLKDLVFQCNSGGGPSTALYPSGNLGYDFTILSTAIDNRYEDAANLISGNRLEIIDKSLASIAIAHSDFYFPGDNQTTQYSRYKDAYRLIQQNKTEIVNSAWSTMISDPANSGVVATETKCKRDIGYFIDAVSTDIFTGGNRYSIEFIKQYFDGSGSPLSNGLVGEESASIDAFEAARDLMKQAITNQLTIKDSSVSIGSSVYGDGNVSVANTSSIACSDVQSTLDTLTAIITEPIGSGNLITINSININYGLFLNGENKCRRDIAYVVDALIKDVRFGTNKYIREATRAYFDASGAPIADGLSGEEAPSVTAFNSIRDYAKKAITNQLNFRDLSIIADPLTGFNTSPNSCANVQSNIDNLISILTTSVSNGNLNSYPQLFTSGRFTVNVGVSTLDHTYIGGGTINSGITTTIFPDNTHGQIFPVERVIDPNTFESTLGGTIIQHTYYGGGSILKFRPFQTINTQVKDLGIQDDPLVGTNQSPAGCRNVVSAMRSCIGIVTTIVGSGLTVFRSAQNPTGIKTTYPGNNGAGSEIENDPSFSPGTGQIFKGPYIRNCTNFIPDSIGMKIDGFPAEPGDEDDIGVQGSMSVDSYTQYNQNGIGVSISNGAYAQLVSIFTICCNEAIVTQSGGQCDLTNSNASFGNKGLVSKGISGVNSKSIYRKSANVSIAGSIGDIELTVSGVGTYRPYDGEVFYIGKLYYSLNSITVTDGGSGYQNANDVDITIDSPTGPNGITAQAIPTVLDGRITDITLINSGTQYEYTPSITVSAPLSGGGEAGSAVVSKIDPLYYKISSATLPNTGITTITSVQGLNNNVSIGDTVYLARQSLQIATTISFEYIGAGTNIFTARPAVGGVPIQENEVVKEDGGEATYTSTDQAGNFRIGDGVVINQASGTVSGRAYLKSLFNNVTPFILALGD
jgi:hypothetical protein